MSKNEPSIIVVTGIQAAGKSTIGRLLAERFERGAFVEADSLQKIIVSGGVWVTDVQGPGAMPQGESASQLRLRLKNSCLLARSFRDSGFTATIDDIIVGDRWDHLREDLAGVPFHLVVLAPDTATVIHRDATRGRDPVGPEWAEYLDREFRTTMSGIGMWVDTTHQTPEQTVDEIMRRLPDEGLIE